MADSVAASVGVSSEPEITLTTLGNDDKFIVLASDGVWEFLSNEDVVSIVQPYYIKQDPTGACGALVTESLKKWQQNEEVVDDTTCIVVFLSNN